MTRTLPNHEEEDEIPLSRTRASALQQPVRNDGISASNIVSSKRPTKPSTKQAEISKSQLAIARIVLIGSPDQNQIAQLQNELEKI